MHLFVLSFFTSQINKAPSFKMCIHSVKRSGKEKNHLVIVFSWFSSILINVCKAKGCLPLLFEWSHVTMHCFKMLLFLFSAIEITTLHTHITKFMPNVEAKKCWTQIFSLACKLYLHNILHLVEIGIVLPISNAEVERVF